MVGVCGELGGGRELTLPLLANSLLHFPNEAACVIDTTGNFDVLAIYSGIVSRLRSDSSLFQGLARSTAGQEMAVEDVAAKVLDRLKIMRVFDLVGVMEAVGEIRSELEARQTGDGVRLQAVVKPVLPDPPARERDKVDKGAKERVVADSEDEEDEEDEEMLFDLAEQNPTKSTSPPRDSIPTPSQGLHPRLPPPTISTSNNEDDGTPEKISFVLIDNLAHVLTPLLKKDYIQGTQQLHHNYFHPIYKHPANTPPAHALATPLLHTLSHLTHTHSLTTILLNPTTTPTPPLSRPTPGPSDHHHQPQPNQPPRQVPPPPPSIFADNKEVPALGGLLGRCVDLEVLVSKMGERKGDVRERRKGKDVIGVVEVVSDRWGGRVGEWGMYVGDGEGGVRDV
ncbi:hypothetical protein P154DRAFT_537911 [Amniculicola lignicola CBS 123094]|uniref:DNA recombination and repair protein Rad51-like C-terminal domain-containing protein n=1 Tax=Amniculicola lignicola CBS 123094 TaxID=1392246 RepID=A0A6A5W659_9PLEO|nr:hypothetical protein P154DRAFT_537911 [Amniculicola lignicola CBS 123094]